MRILYVTYIDLCDDRQIGVVKKIRSQIHALKKDFEVSLFCLRGSEAVLDDGEGYRTVGVLTGRSRKSVPKLILSMKNDYDAFYFRLPGFIDKWFYDLLKALKKEKKINIIEIPTYPLKGELRKNLVNYWKARSYIRFVTRIVAYTFHWFLKFGIHKYVDLNVTFIACPDIWKIKTVCVDNGVDTASCGIAVPTPADNEIRMLFVGNVAEWHGVDRVIEGMKEYYANDATRTKTVHLRIVGEGNAIPLLKDKVKEYSIDRYVCFVGKKNGPGLFDEYGNADIAIGSLGMHRIGVINGSTLKVKEYMSYGKPFVYAYNEKLLPDDYPFALKVAANDEPISIRRILDFYEGVRSHADYQSAMHRFAVQKYDWNVQMQPIAEYLRQKQS